jgi:hypothetical protein
MSQIIATVLLALFSSLFGQQIAEEKKSVAFLFGTVHPRKPDGTPVVGPNGKTIAVEQPLGTAFFVLYPDARGGPDFAFLYLVTAKHVLKDGNGTFLKEVKLRLNRKDGRPAEYLSNIPVSDATGKLVWFHDSDEAIDVAVIPLLPDQKLFDFKAIPVEWFVDDETFKKEKVEEGDLLHFIGLMTQYYGAQKNYPIVRRGTLAMMTDEKIETPTGLQHAFIAELASWPGNSGSPVFLNLSGMRNGNLTVGANHKFIGVISGGFLNKFKGTVLDATVIGGNEFQTGISFIVPAARVKAILEAASARAHRDNFIPKKATP